ncbi:MAG: NAD(P)/FAD-dependent oxidoreductase [Flavobacteriales bacterium]|nr:NAD(P)/FAD-dependent oxidoreductase [Flavobacteriales bacterium]
MATPGASVVCVIGAGPGGCSATLRLRQLGIPTILIDKAVFPRDKVCGDALSGKVMRTMERLDKELVKEVMGDALLQRSWGVTFVAPGGGVLRVPFSREVGKGEAPGAILRRLRFDDLLFQRTLASGASVLQGHVVRSFEHTQCGWRLGAQGPDGPRSIHASMVLDASGANSVFARQVGGLSLRPEHHAAGVRAYYNGVKGLDADGFIELHFLRSLLPGYLWVFPLPGGRANVGLGLRSDVVRERRIDLKAELVRLVQEPPTLRDRFAEAQLECAIQGMGLPLGSKRYPISGDGYLLIGDAAHLIDPFTGEGISHAMISGVHAAEVAADMLARNDLSATAAKAYDDRVWKRLGQELSISTRLQRLAKRSWLFDLVVDRATKNPALADTIACMFTDLDLRAQLKRPGFYWKLVRGTR